MKTWIKNSLALFVLVLISVVAYSQPPMGSVKGKVVDAKDNTPLPYTNVLLLKAKDSTLVSGIACSDDGSFSIENIMPGAYMLKIKFIGYRDSRSDKFFIGPKNPEKNFGVIKLNSSSNQISEVTVTARKDEFINSIDKKVYNVANSITATGGSASDVLKNIPSVTVDIDGNVSLRGSTNVTIMIDGKPSGMLSGDPATALQQVPSSIIDQVEVITNPSAKYDAEGMAGIINIKTKKGKTLGLNGVASAGVSSMGGYNANITLNNKIGKWNFFGTYGYRNDLRSSTANQFQNNHFIKKDTAKIPNKNLNDTTLDISNSSGKFNHQSHMLKIGTEWSIDSVNTLTLSVGGNLRDMSRPENIYESLKDLTTNKMDSIMLQNNSSQEKGHGWEVNLDYKRLFPKLKSELSFTSNFSINNRSSSHVNLRNDSVFIKGLKLDSLQQNGTVDNRSINSVVQLDYMQPTENGKFETGIKYTLRDNQNDQNDYVYNYSTMSSAVDPFTTNKFSYKEQIFAGYGTYTAKFGDFGISAGLRVEQLYANGHSTTTTKDTSFVRNDDPAFFPSGSLKYVLGINEFQMNYSRRINRPDMRMLNPTIDNSDPKNIRQGNPYLKPDFTDSYDLSWHLTTTNSNLLASVFYRYTTDLMTMTRTSNSEGVGIVQFQNMNWSKNLGVDLTYSYRFGMMGNVMISGSAYHNTTNASNLDASNESDSWNYNARINGMMMLSRSTSIQVMGMYMAPRVLPTGRMWGMSSIDMGIKQDLFKRKASILLNVSDIFNTRRINTVNELPGYYFEMHRQFTSRVATLTFTYRFGKVNDSKKKPNMQQNMQQDNQMQMDSF